LKKRELTRESFLITCDYTACGLKDREILMIFSHCLVHKRFFALYRLGMMKPAIVADQPNLLACMGG
jgi:hypothetical protein